LEEYKRTLDLSKAISEGKRLADIQKRKEEAERQKAELEKAMKEEEERIQEEPTKAEAPIEEPTPTQTEENETPRTWIGFKAYLSKEEAHELGEFIKAHNIKIQQILI
jgi:hypothetical protein